MLARGQAQPLAVHETAIRASIRYTRSVSDWKLKFRSYEYSGVPSITTYVDASWAAEKSTNRKNASGAMLSSFVIAVSRPGLQQSVACSPGEAELCALFEGAKETIGIQHAVAHVFGCQVEELPVSSSASVVVKTSTPSNALLQLSSRSPVTCNTRQSQDPDAKPSLRSNTIFRSDRMVMNVFGKPRTTNSYLLHVLQRDCSRQCLGHQIGSILRTSNKCDGNHTFVDCILQKADPNINASQSSQQP